MKSRLRIGPYVLAAAVLSHGCEKQNRGLTEVRRNAPACIASASCYEAGTYYVQHGDDQMARVSFQMACKSTDEIAADACHEIGLIRLRQSTRVSGKEAEREAQAARAAFADACRKGSQRACAVSATLSGKAPTPAGDAPGNVPVRSSADKSPADAKSDEEWCRDALRMTPARDNPFVVGWDAGMARLPKDMKQAQDNIERECLGDALAAARAGAGPTAGPAFKKSQDSCKQEKQAQFCATRKHLPNAEADALFDEAARKRLEAWRALQKDNASSSKKVLPIGRAAVISGLKSPSTAKVVDEAVVMRCPSGQFVSTHVVDAQNSFGAVLRETLCSFVDVDAKKGSIVDCSEFLFAAQVASKGSIASIDLVCGTNATLTR